MNTIVDPAMIKEAVATRKKEIMDDFIELKMKQSNSVKMTDLHYHL